MVGFKTGRNKVGNVADHYYISCDTYSNSSTTR